LGKIARGDWVFFGMSRITGELPDYNDDPFIIMDVPVSPIMDVPVYPSILSGMSPVLPVLTFVFMDVFGCLVGCH
jgi:hypothetical protein